MGIISHNAFSWHSDSRAWLWRLTGLFKVHVSWGEWAVFGMNLGRELSHSGEGRLKQRERPLWCFFPYQSSQCKEKKIIWSHSSGAEDSTAKLRSCLQQCVRLKDEILILAPLFQQLCHVQHHTEEGERCHPASTAAFVAFKRFKLNEEPYETGKRKWKSHWDIIVWQSTWAEYLEITDYHNQMLCT